MRILLKGCSFRLPLYTNIPAPQKMLRYFKPSVPRNAVSKEHSCRAAIECLDYRSEWLLASSIPYLHLYWRGCINTDLPRVKLDAQCSSVAFFKLVLRKAIEQTALSDTWWSNNDHLESLIITLHLLLFICKTSNNSFHPIFTIGSHNCPQSRSLANLYLMTDWFYICCFVIEYICDN